MILTPREWPHLVLPLKKRDGSMDMAVFAPPAGILDYPEDAEITILIGNMFLPLHTLPQKTYANVDALLDDGWTVD
jgi:hypothetical protein